MMNRIADLVFEGQMLKHLPRSGYAYLGVGEESVAEHTFITMFIAWILSHLAADVDRERLISMCLVHDLPEARIGDLNAVQKRYVRPDEAAAVSDALDGIPFADAYRSLIDEFNEGTTLVAKLARDADHLSLLVDLKSLSDRGYRTPEKWRAHVQERLQTEPGKQLAAAISRREFDGWWLDGVDQLTKHPEAEE
jgi:putative hydrolase of HD superfamily